MPNGTYGGVRGKETKAGQKTFVSRPTRFLEENPKGIGICSILSALAFKSKQRVLDGRYIYEDIRFPADE